MAPQGWLPQSPSSMARMGFPQGPLPTTTSVASRLQADLSARMLHTRSFTTRLDASYSRDHPILHACAARLTMARSGLQPRAVQGMLDFDFICKRSTPSVAGIIYTFGGQFVSKMYVSCSGTCQALLTPAAGTGERVRRCCPCTNPSRRPLRSTMTSTPWSTLLRPEACTARPWNS